MSNALTEQTFSANEAACVTGVPLKQVHRIIDAGLLDEAVSSENGARAILATALVGLRLAYDTTELVTLEGRRRLVRRALEDPEARSVSADAISVDVRPMKSDLRRRMATLEKAKKMIVIDKDIRSGAPCFKGTRIPVHDIADMLANGDSVAALVKAYPSLSEAQVDAARVYAEAYPRRGRRRQEPPWRKNPPCKSTRIALDKLPSAS